jgi:hypothetical protein
MSTIKHLTSLPLPQPSVTLRLQRTKLSRLEELASHAMTTTALISCADSVILRKNIFSSKPRLQATPSLDARFHNTPSQMSSTLRSQSMASPTPVTTRLMVTLIHSFLMPAPSFWLLTVPLRFKSRVSVSLTPDSARPLMITEPMLSLAVVAFAPELPSSLTRTL